MIKADQQKQNTVCFPTGGKLMATLITEAAISALLEGFTDESEVDKLKKSKQIKKVESKYKKKFNYSEAKKIYYG